MESANVALPLWRDGKIKILGLTGGKRLSLAPEIPIRTEVETFALEDANDALDRLRSGRIRGAAVLRITAAAAGT